MNSVPVSAQTATRGRLGLYGKMLVKSPGRFAAGLRDTLAESLRFLVRPRIDVRMSVGQRAKLLTRYLIAELNIKGATTFIDGIWLTYAAALSSSKARQWIEAGCFKGLSTTRLSLLADIYDRQLCAYDTFEGIPDTSEIYDAVDGGPSYRFKTGTFSGSLEDVRRNIATYGRVDRVTFVKGDVRKTMKERPLDKISFAFLDVDLVDAYRGCFSALAPAVEEGTVIAIHEAALAPIRELIEDTAFWSAQGCRAPRVTYVAEEYGIPRGRFLALLRW